MITRRSFSLACAGIATGAAQIESPPMRAITRGPKLHWFANHQKPQFDPSGRLVLGMEVAFDLRQPNSGEAVRIGFVDLDRDDLWIDLGAESRAWSWHTGCLLHWLPGSRSEILWRDLEAGEIVARTLDIRTRKGRVLRAAIEAVSPDGRWAVARDGTQLVRVDLRSGRIENLDVAVQERASQFDISPDGKYIAFVEMPSDGARAVVCTSSGGGVRPLEGATNFSWRKDAQMLLWSSRRPGGAGLCLYECERGRLEPVPAAGLGPEDTFTCAQRSPWVVCNSHSAAGENLFLLDAATWGRVPLLLLPRPGHASGEWNCPLQPRLSPDGRAVVIDSAHRGERQMYLVDISAYTSNGFKR